MSATQLRSGPAIADATALFLALAGVHDDGGNFENMPRTTTGALIALLSDDDIGQDIQERATRRLAHNAIEALAKALIFARSRLSNGTEIDQAHVRGIDDVLRQAGVELTVSA